MQNDLYKFIEAYAKDRGYIIEDSSGEKSSLFFGTSIRMFSLMRSGRKIFVLLYKSSKNSYFFLLIYVQTRNWQDQFIITKSQLLANSYFNQIVLDDLSFLQKSNQPQLSENVIMRLSEVKDELIFLAKTGEFSMLECVGIEPVRTFNEYSGFFLLMSKTNQVKVFQKRIGIWIICLALLFQIRVSIFF